MRVALVHDHLIQQGGAERVLQAFQAMWPDAPTFTLYYDKEALKADFGHKVLPSKHSVRKTNVPLLPPSHAARNRAS